MTPAEIEAAIAAAIAPWIYLDSDVEKAARAAVRVVAAEHDALAAEVERLRLLLAAAERQIESAVERWDLDDPAREWPVNPVRKAIADAVRGEPADAVLGYENERDTALARAEKAEAERDRLIAEVRAFDGDVELICELAANGEKWALRTEADGEAELNARCMVSEAKDRARALREHLRAIADRGGKEKP